MASMTNERGHITDGRWYRMDESQAEVLKHCSNYHLDDRCSSRGKGTPKNVLLYGSSGTGKTLLGAQLVNMRIGHYKRLKMDLRVVIIVAEEKVVHLMQSLKKTYFSYLQEGETRYPGMTMTVEYHQGLKHWGIETPTKDFRSGFQRKEGFSVENVHSLLEKVADENPIKTIIFMDEVEMNVAKHKIIQKHFQNLENLHNKHENVDIIMALSPWVDWGKLSTFQVMEPTDGHVFAQRLTNRHRNCREIYDFWYHSSQCEVEQGVGVIGVLNHRLDKIDEKSKLPQGCKTRWIRRDKHRSLQDILEEVSKPEKSVSWCLGTLLIPR